MPVVDLAKWKAERDKRARTLPGEKMGPFQRPFNIREWVTQSEPAPPGPFDLAGGIVVPVGPRASYAIYNSLRAGPIQRWLWSWLHGQPGTYQIQTQLPRAMPVLERRELLGESAGAYHPGYGQYAWLNPRQDVARLGNTATHEAGHAYAHSRWPVADEFPFPEATRWFWQKSPANAVGYVGQGARDWPAGRVMAEEGWVRNLVDQAYGGPAAGGSARLPMNATVGGYLRSYLPVRGPETNPRYVWNLLDELVRQREAGQLRPPTLFGRTLE